MQIDVHEVARGKWRGLLLAAGLHPSNLNGQHGPCPICKGKDRFRWDNKAGSGSFFCSQHGGDGNGGGGTGIDLLMQFKGWDFRTARAWVLEQAGQTKVEPPKAPRDNARGMEKLTKLWEQGDRLGRNDPATAYLRARGIDLECYPNQLRFHARAPYWHPETKRNSYHPALLSKLVAADLQSWTLQTTYLDRDGNKANLPEVRKLGRVDVPFGGAVRLTNSAETMGVATGVETALSAGLLFDIPVWATLTDGLLVKWRPPPKAKHIIIFGDNDLLFGGQSAAFGLAHALAVKRLHVSVRIPDEKGDDWNDVWLSEGREYYAARYQTAA